MTVLASQIVDRARSQLVDENTTKRWSDAELLRFLSDGQRTIAALEPDVAYKVSVVQLAIGTRQALPADGNTLLGITRNMGADGLTPGRAIRIISRDIIDAQNPNWHSETKTQIVYNYVYDPSDPAAYFVYPPANGNGHIELNYSFTPAEILLLTTPITLPDIYLTPLFDYVMFRAHQKDSDFAAGQSAADAYIRAFKLFLDGSSSGELENNPNLQMSPFNPGVKGSAK